MEARLELVAAAVPPFNLRGNVEYWRLLEVSAELGEAVVGVMT